MYIYRPTIKGNFSFENIFHAVADALADQIDIEEYYCNSFFDVNSLLKIRFHKANIFHITGSVNYLALSLPSQSTVLTVHDVGFYENPVNKGLKKMIYEWLWLRLPIKKAGHITVVSEFTKEKIHLLFGTPLEKISVIPNPVVFDFTFEPKVDRSGKLNILQIGSGAHKNILGLIEAVRDLPVHLIMVSKLSKVEEERLNAYRVSYENHFSLPADELKMLYKRCDILYFASFYEGFGMPIIEAQALGRPVITSNLGAMKEVAGDGALLVNPNEIKEITTVIKSFIDDQIDLANVLKLGKRNAEKYTIKAVAQKYFELYSRILHD